MLSYIFCYQSNKDRKMSLPHILQKIVFDYCYHLVKVVCYCLTQSDHYKRQIFAIKSSLSSSLFHFVCLFVCIMFMFLSIRCLFLLVYLSVCLSFTTLVLFAVDSSDDILKQILIKTIYKFITLLCVNYITLHYINLRHLLLIVLEYEKIGFFLPKIKIHLMSQAPKGQFLLNEKQVFFP